jgi:flagellar assembly protein FliH
MDSMMKPTKFDFDTEFDENGEILREGESFKRFFTQDDIDAARMWGVEEGRELEEGRCAQSLQAIASQMQLILSRLAVESEALRTESATLAIAAARKIAGAALDSFPAETIDALAAETVRDLRSEPRFSVRCAPDLVEMLVERLDKTARDAGFEGAIVIRGDDSMTGADVRLEWGSGAIERSASDIDTRLQDIVERWLVAGPAEETPSTDTGTTVPDVSAA